jgi:hypothetical protein
MLNTPVRYCANVTASPALKMSWKKRKSTSKNPTMRATASAFFTFPLSSATWGRHLSSPETRLYAANAHRRHPRALFFTSSQRELPQSARDLAVRPVGRRLTLRLVSRSNGHRSPVQSLDHIAELAQTLAPLLEDAADASARKSGDGPVTVGRGKGFTDARPVETVALDPRRSQIRRASARAALLIEEAEATLEETSGVIANGYLRLDPQEWVRAVEKRRAALGR